MTIKTPPVRKQILNHYMGRKGVLIFNKFFKTSLIQTTLADANPLPTPLSLFTTPLPPLETVRTDD